ncbi:hypothetical protein PI124_g21847 [Phytophthora idaei]|nr:hypothetical protein PI124_g21847 [Phytophthora idaei]
MSSPPALTSPPAAVTTPVDSAVATSNTSSSGCQPPVTEEAAVTPRGTPVSGGRLASPPSTAGTADGAPPPSASTQASDAIVIDGDDIATLRPTSAHDVSAVSEGAHTGAANVPPYQSTPPNSAFNLDDFARSFTPTEVVPAPAPSRLSLAAKVDRLFEMFGASFTLAQVACRQTSTRRSLLPYQ